MWKGLTTNLSKHTCRFSEWPWPQGTPTFVDANDMTAYLESYANEFVDPACFRFQCQVDHIGMEDETYKVEWTDLQTNSKHSMNFQGVVVATGIFSKPHWPQLDDPIDETNIVHSNYYTNHQEYENETVAVVGSSFSALEISADVSKSAHRVVNIVPSIPWVLPRYIPSNNTILPVDLAFYQRSRDFPQVPEQTAFTPESSKARHEFLQSIVGGRQAQSPLGIPTDFSIPPSVAISDYYLDLVVDGTIDVIHGRFQGVDESGVKIASGDTIRVVPDITKVICCTGYECSLEQFMSEPILETLEYDGSDTFSPMTLGWDTLHPSLPNLAFCGMYRGPYMGIMELQGRLAAKVMAAKIIGGSGGSDDLDQALGDSKSIRQHRPRAQFPRFDYVGEMDTLATTQALSQDAFPKFNTKEGDMVSPAFYQSSNDEVAKGCQEELSEEVMKGIGRMPGIVSSAIVGSWNFDRRIVHLSSLSSSPTGSKEEHVYGSIRYSRSQGLDYVKYREDGFYELAPSKTLNVFREYEYVAKDNSILEIYFVEGGKRAYIFLSLKFTEQNDQGYWVASSDHLCIKDLYKADFQVKLDGLTATEIIITYRVKGPAKDYESTTIMTPKL
jgi:hypothetical protein